MRPLPSEVIAGVRRILKETIEPELRSGHARSRLAEVRAVLKQVDWDDAAFALAARNRALAEVLDRIAAWRATDPAREAAVPACQVQLPGEDRFAAHQEAYLALASASVSLVDPLADWCASHPTDDEARELRRSLLTAL